MERTYHPHNSEKDTQHGLFYTWQQSRCKLQRSPDRTITSLEVWLPRSIKGRVKKKLPGEWKEQGFFPGSPAHVMLGGSWGSLFSQSHIAVATTSSVSDARSSTVAKIANHGSECPFQTVLK